MRDVLVLVNAVTHGVRTQSTSESNSKREIVRNVLERETDP